MMVNGGVAEWAVPSEYASSPIAQELTQSEVEERPRPPIPAMYMNTSTTTSNSTTDRGEESVYSDFVLKRNSSTSSMSGKTVTLLEQIIRTHAVWYLPHLGRPEVLHLLRRMEPGNFIVRASTRENCMALSVKLAPGAHVEIDHYIIEKLVVPVKSSTVASSAKVVRLEGSPLTFRSLPLLIEHYCVNEDELEHRLQLPSAIRAGHSNNNNNTMPRCHGAESDTSSSSTWFMDRLPHHHHHIHPADDSIYDEVASRASAKTSANYYAVNDTVKNNNQNVNEITRRSSAMLLTPDMANSQKTTPKKRRSSSRASSSSNSRFATVCVGDIMNSFDSDRNAVAADETDSGTSAHSPPSKQDRFEDVHISRSDRRSQSVRSHKSVTASPKDGHIPSSTTTTLSRPRSFLRSLLSFGSSASKEQKRKESLDIDSTPRLANCEYFTPWDSNGVKVKTLENSSDFSERTILANNR
uniref:SH2 domain-containing protein n=2 Tax=Caenorhabditis japonica TaxID=281687 RepID=A0A8R1E186_CAEJA